MPVLWHVNFNKQVSATVPRQVTLHKVVATGHLRNRLRMLRSTHYVSKHEMVAWKYLVSSKLSNFALLLVSFVTLCDDFLITVERQ